MLQWQEPAGQFEPGLWANAPSRKVLDNLQTFEVWTRMDAQSKWVQTNIQRETPGHVKLVIKANDRFWPELIMTVQR